MDTELIIGDNSHGFDNEKLIVNALNNKKLNLLPGHFKKFINTICSDYHIKLSDNIVIQAKKAETEVDPETKRKINPKPDIYIIIGDNSFGISTKMGSGNSVHQEKVESFIEWLKNSKISIKDPTIYDDLRLLIWGDGTLSGDSPVERDSTGNIKNRFTTQEFKSLYPEKWRKIQDFLILHKKEIIQRALFFGKTNKEVHYIYHGTVTHGSWISQQELLNFNLNKPLNTSTFNVGRLSFQLYNADKKGTPSGSKKRGIVQFKYANLSKDIDFLILNNTDNKGSYEGDIEEFNLSKIMNKNKNHKFWKFLSKKLNLSPVKNYYIVKVSGNKYSKNVNKKVMCKTDNYIIQTDTAISKHFLLKNEYQITENDLKNIGKYNIVSKSGISVKQKDSKSYTITKMTIDSFRSAFNSYIEDIDFYILALILYSDKKQVTKNKKIAKDLNIDETIFCKYFNSRLKLSIENLQDFKSLSELSKLIKNKIKNTIDNNKTLKNSIFKGTDWFDEPYCINYIYAYGSLTDNIFIPYHIDNGSGRSKGNYTIIIKPNK
ncbi:hypothetical protein O3794_05560 [Gemella sanguinis]|uniref:hypothetical protein n=1 Tax=Gemella sanguinis TaxID=84135 RepID=UPI00352E76FA